MAINNNYKDSVFTALFGSPEALRELYSAIAGAALPPDTPIAINTLREVLYMEMLNDISFEIGGKLVILIEHQSTINPNMPLRLLMYMARIYEKIVKERRGIYTTKLVRIPRPEFYVLYNGAAPYPEEKTLRLSESFEDPSSLGPHWEGPPGLELEAKVLNINAGMNEEIAVRSRILSGYRAFVGRIRENEKKGSGKEEAIREAVKYCISHEILRDFLEANASEVVNMLFEEWNLEDAKQVWYEEGLEKGLEEGREEGREAGLEEGLERGLDAGREEVVRKALAKGLPIDMIHDLTGYEIERIRTLQEG